MTHRTPLTIFFALAFGSVAFAQDEPSAFEILMRHERNKSAELESYLENQPKATDRGRAIEMLIGSYMILGEEKDDRRLELYEEKLETMLATKQVTLENFLGRTVSPMVEIYAKRGDREAGMSLLYRAQGILGPYLRDPSLMQTIIRMERMLKAPMVGEPLQPFAFTSVRGEKVDLAEMKGKYVLVTFWSTNCPPCIAEMPVLKQIYEKYDRSQFEIVGVTIDQDRLAVDKFLKEKQLPWPQHFDGQSVMGKVASTNGVMKTPSSYLVGKDGVIIGKDLYGPALAAKLEEVIDGKKG